MTIMVLTQTFTASPILAQQAAPGGSPYGTHIFMGLMFAAMWFLMIAPQRKKQKEHEKMLAALGTGDEVVTTGGIFGEITNVKSDRFTLRIADGVKIEVGKGFIHQVLKKTGEEKK